MNLISALVVLLMLTPAMAQDVKQHDHVAIGDVGNFFATWKRPTFRNSYGARTKSCCSTRDCQGVEVVRRDGKWHVRGHKFGRGKDVHIPDNLIESNQPDPRESPDGKSYACLDTTGAPLCLVLGSGM